MKKNLIALLVSLIAVLCASQVILADESILPFSDVKTTTWYYENLCDLYTNGIINGFEDGTFKGSQSLKKDQMLKLVITTIAPNANYIKNENEKWFAPYLRICQSLGIEDFPELVTNTDEDGNTYTTYKDVDITTYNVDIQREEIAKYAFKACMYGTNSSLYNMYTQVSDEDIEKVLKENYKDYASISSDAKLAIYQLYNLGIMTGDDNKNFNPKQNLTRAEATAIIYRLRKLRTEFSENENLDTEKINTEVSEAGEGTLIGTIVSSENPVEEYEKQLASITYTEERIKEIFSSTENMVEEFGDAAYDFSDEDVTSLYNYYMQNMLIK